MKEILSLVGEVAIIAALVAANGFFVAAEFALVKVRASQLHLLEKTGGWRVRFALRATSQLDIALSATQLGITLASLGLGWVGKPFVAGRLEPLLSRFGMGDPTTIASVSFAVAFAVITFLHIVFGELAPKSFAIQRPQRTSLLVSAPLLIFYYLFLPVIWLLNRAANRFLHWAGLGAAGGEGDDELSNAEFEFLLARARHVHPGDALVNRLMLRSLRLREINARQVMRARDQIVALWSGLTHEENLGIARASQHSRFLVCGKSLDDVKGVLLMREWLWQLHDTGPEALLSSLVRPVLAFTEKTPIHEMIARFRASRSHLAVVRTDAGAVAGLVSFEDVLEEIVGSIRDESDTESGPIHDQSEHVIVVSASLPVRELQAETGWTFEGELRETVETWISRRRGRAAAIGEAVVIGDLVATRLEVAPGSPGRVRVERKVPTSPSG